MIRYLLLINQYVIKSSFRHVEPWIQQLGTRGGQQFIKGLVALFY